MYCGKCGAENDDGEWYCYRCGSKLHDTSEAGTEQGDTQPDGSQNRTSQEYNAPPNYEKTIENRISIETIVFLSLGIVSMALAFYAILMDFDLVSNDQLNLFNESTTWLNAVVDGWSDEALAEIALVAVIVLAFVSISIPLDIISGVLILAFAATSQFKVPELGGNLTVSMEMSDPSVFYMIAFILMVIGLIRLLMYPGVRNVLKYSAFKAPSH